MDLPNFQIAILVQEDVARLKVTVYDVGRVQELEGSENLVDEVLNVLGQKLLSRANHFAQISLHQFAD